MTAESIKPVLDKLTRHEPNHKSYLFFINDTKDETANLINVSTTIQSPKHLKNSQENM